MARFEGYSKAILLQADVRILATHSHCHELYQASPTRVAHILSKDRPSRGPGGWEGLNSRQWSLLGGCWNYSGPASNQWSGRRCPAQRERMGQGTPVSLPFCHPPPPHRCPGRTT